jgi:hypothetical protein
VQDIYRRVRAISALSGENAAPALRGLALAHLVRGELHAAEQMSRELLAAAGGDASVVVEGAYMLGVTCFWLGKFGEAIDHLERGAAIELDDRPLHCERFAQDPQVVCLVRAAAALWHAGFPHRARARSQRALELARERDHRFSLAYVLHWKAWLDVVQEAACALDAIDESVAYAQRHDYPYWHTQGRILAAWLRADPREMEQALVAYRETGSLLCRPHYVSLLARLLVREQRVAEAQGLLDRELAEARGRGERWCEPELLRVRASVMVGLDRADASRDLLEALVLARMQGAPTVELAVLGDLLALDPAAAIDRAAEFESDFAGVEEEVRARARALAAQNARSDPP